MEAATRSSSADQWRCLGREKEIIMAQLLLVWGGGGEVDGEEEMMM